MDFEGQLPAIHHHADRLSGLTTGHGVVEGHIFSDKTMVWKQKNLFRLAQVSSQILEIGFNAGHSAMLMLMANPKLELFCFDLGEHGYVDPCYQYVAETFGTRFRLIKGDSSVTIPTFIQNHPNTKFDGFHVDGCHHADAARKDLRNCALLAKHGALVVFDDTDYTQLDKLWQDTLSEGLVIQVDLYETSSSRL